MQTKKHISEADLKEISRQLEQRQRQGKKVLDNVDFMKLFSISRNTSTNWRNSGKIKFSRVGRRVFFKLKEVERMLDEHVESEGQSRKAEEKICNDLREDLRKSAGNQGSRRGRRGNAEDAAKDQTS